MICYQKGKGGPSYRGPKEGPKTEGIEEPPPGSLKKERRLLEKKIGKGGGGKKLIRSQWGGRRIRKNGGFSWEEGEMGETGGREKEKRLGSLAARKNCRRMNLTLDKLENRSKKAKRQKKEVCGGTFASVVCKSEKKEGRAKEKRNTSKTSFVSLGE